MASLPERNSAFVRAKSHLGTLQEYTFEIHSNRRNHSSLSTEIVVLANTDNALSLDQELVVLDGAVAFLNAWERKGSSGSRETRP